jgi:hypothetical protein
MQLSELLMRRGLWLDLEWVPREENIEADQLTNLDFTGFDASKRMEVDVSAAQFPLLHELLQEESSFRNELAGRKRDKALVGPAVGASYKKRKVKTPWG